MERMSPANTAVRKVILDEWCFKGGAGWPNLIDSLPGSSAYASPWVFLSLPQLVSFYLTASIYQPRFRPMAYSLKKVPSSTAVCVALPPAYITMYFYMAPTYASQCNSFLLSNFKINPSPGTGPVISAKEATSLKAAYVLIANGAPSGPSFFGIGNISSTGTLLS